MGRRLLGLVILLAAAGTTSCDKPASTSYPATQISVYFSPHGGVTDAVVGAIGDSKSTLDILAYSFTSAPIAHAITDAQDRGVKVRIVLDKSNWKEKYTSATFFLDHKVPTWIDDQHAIAHNKVMIIDGETLITGSFNFTKAAEDSNAENLLILKGCPDLIAKYQANFEEHLGHSQTYTGPQADSDGSGDTKQKE